MQTKRVQCPSCGQVLEVRNTHNETLKEFTCPKCKALLQAKFPPQQEPLEAKTYLGPRRPLSDIGATRLVGTNAASTKLVVPNVKPNAKPILEYDGQQYELEEGQNIVGRKCTTSKATIQIPTDDPYMSRQHCKITVSILPNGMKKVGLCNFRNKNRTYINDQLIVEGDVVCLSDGYKIKMGCTIVTFKLR